MRSPRRGFFWSSLCALALGGSSCGTDAVGVEACREIEGARCRAAAQCGLIEDVENCQRFYQDHCLHGVRLEQSPRSVDVRQCVEAIDAAGRCADREGPRTAPAECGSNLLTESSARRVCDIVEEPERAPDCAFLHPEPERDTDTDTDTDTDADTDNDEPDAG